MVTRFELVLEHDDNGGGYRVSDAHSVDGEPTLSRSRIERMDDDGYGGPCSGRGGRGCQRRWLWVRMGIGCDGHDRAGCPRITLF